MLLEMFMTVHILAGGTDVAPEMTIIQGRISDPASCSQNVLTSQQRAPDTVDVVSGRPIVTTLYSCVLVDTEYLKEDIDLAVEMYGE